MVLTAALSLLLSARLDSPVTDRAEALAKEALARSHEPRAAAPLIRLRELLDDVDDLNLLAEPFSALLARRGTDPFVRILAQVFMADVERARGRTVRASQQLDSLGFVQDWYLVGSFDNEGKAGCDTDFGPESSADLRATYPTAGREVGWRKPEAQSVDGYVDLSVSLRPNSEAVGYALGFLEVDAETRATLALGVSGGFRLFVNGVKVAGDDRYNQPRMDQRRLEVRLRKGLNRVLLKVCQASGPYGFYFRALGPRGPLASPLPEVVPPLERGLAPLPQALPTLAEVLERQLKASPSNPELRADYATVLAFSRASPDTEKWPEREAERAALQKPTDVELQLIAQGLADDANDKRRLLEAALALSPKHPWARLKLAQLELAREHPELALRLAEALLVEHPRFGPAWEVKVRALEGLGEKVAALRTAEEAFARLAVLPAIAREAAAAARRADRLDEAVARWRVVTGLRFDDLNTRRGLAGMLADLGRVAEAAEQYEKVLALDPFDSATVLRLAELLAANGQRAASSAAFARARALAPDEPDVFEREGRSLLHAREKDAALAAFQRALVLRPQNPALKELVRTLRGEESAASSTEAFPLASLLAEAQSLDDEDAVILAELTHVRVQSSGLSSRFEQLVVKVASARGVEAYRTIPITWSPDRQEVRVVKARITKPDGSIIESYSEQDRTVEPWAGMYFDTRSRSLTFPALAVGDVLEVQWRLDDTAIDNLLSDYWGDVEAVQSVYPKRHFRLVVDMPSARTLFWNEKGAPAGLKASTASADGRTVYRFEATQVPRLVPEPQMPGWAEVAGVLHLSTYQSWEQVGRYYHGLVRDQLVATEELKRTVDSVLKGVDRADAAKVVAALYGFVVSQVRYVGLEFGIHGYQPYKVDRVLARRFGDCKDKASLMHAMLKVAGVDSRLVLLRTRDRGVLSAEVASLAAFNHAILYVPKLDLFLDGTAEFHGSRELPSSDRVANVLVVEPEGPSRFFTTLEASPSDNTTTVTMDVTLKLDGSATAKGSLVAVGQGAPELRRSYETGATRQAIFEQQWAQSFPGVKATELKVSDPKALEVPATVNFSMAMPRYAEAQPQSLRFYPFGASRTYTQAMAPLAERRFDAVFSSVFESRLQYTYALPAGWGVAELPADTVERSAFGSLTITVRRAGEKLVVDGTLVMSSARISAKEYPAFRAWLMRVDQAFSRKLVVERPANMQDSAADGRPEAFMGGRRLTPRSRPHAGFSEPLRDARRPVREGVRPL
jgi:tetratricopeptide (TPR) repeat protein